MIHWTFKTIAGVILLAAVSTGSAQQATRMSIATESKAWDRSSIPVISTESGNSRVRSPERLRHKSRAVADPPPPLSNDKYTGLTGKPPRPGTGTDLQAPETPRLDYLQLTIRHSYSGYGWLDLNEIRHIDSKNNSAVFYTATDPSMAWTRAHLKVEAGELYLLDFSVGTSQKTSFSVSDQVFTVEKGTHHLLLYLDAKSSVTKSIMLTSDNADYTFYALDVTRVN